jgi:mRNA interferase MazF
LNQAGTPMVIVLPLTTQVRPSLQLFRVTIPARQKLEQTCQVIVDQPCALDRKRLGEGPLTVLNRDELESVDRGLRLALGLF